MPSARWLRDDDGHLAAILLLDELIGSGHVRTHWFEAGQLAGNRDRVLVVPKAIPAHALHGAVAGLRSGPDAAGFLASPQSRGLPDDVEPVGELRLAGVKCTLYKLGAVREDIMKRAPRRLTKTIGPQRIEEPGSLKGREAWFRGRHDDSS